MNAIAPRKAPGSGKIRQFGALFYLLVLGLFAVAGPYGVLSWGEDMALLEKRQEHIADLKQKMAELKNRVDLLNPNHVDPDLATELLRQNLNVAHPDEYVIELDQKR